MTSASPYAKELEKGRQSVHRAVILTKTILAAIDKGVISKSDRTPVTIADFAAQALLISAVHDAFPDDSFVGEESADVLRRDPDLLERVWQHVLLAGLEDAKSKALLAFPQTKDEMLDIIDMGGKGKGGKQGRIWVLDPVDGTEKFMCNQQYAVALALLEDGQQKLGILGCPNLNLETGRVVEEIIDTDGYGYMISAVTGQGAFIQSMGRDSIAASQKIPKLEEVANLSDLRLVWSNLSRTANTDFPVKMASRLSSELTTALWSAQMSYVALVVGGCNALVKVPLKKNHQSKLWDHVGGMLIAEEAGCKVTDLLGNVIDCTVGRKLGAYGMIVAPEGTHARLLDAVQKLLQEEVEEVG
ncbi:hypothetical protein Egran_06778 [Elaphomyces granulatus]|uniref:3'(2'),5'-bisphosphate nucleotidase n=1 Tax=Elaphomyces granulatus TaxID=519963 RepID=A0A232LMY2_9EURO|nr:hypothetical protein Egran_06778 [Elaphomyces granulatus]